MFFIFMIAIVNVILGFALAVYLGGQSHRLPILGHFFGMPRKRIPHKFKVETAISASAPESSPAVENTPPPSP